MQLKPVGVDIAKSVFQVYHVDSMTGEVVNKAIKRAGFLEYFANRMSCLIGMEACGGAQHWAHMSMKLGHQVKLMPARLVKAFNIGNKSDAAEAIAIWLAVQEPCKAVAVQTEEQQAVLAMHRVRQQLIKFRTMRINALRGLLTEYGEVMGKSRAALDRGMSGALERLANRLAAMLIDTLRERYSELSKQDERIGKIEQRLKGWMRLDRPCQAIAEIPGVGLLTATAAVATKGNAKAFRSGREFAAYIGLVPKHSGSGGKLNLLGISKRGDTYLRTLLIHGARSVLARAKESGSCVEQMCQRRPLNVVIVALANKMARMVWALLAHERQYVKGYVGTKPT